MRRLAAVLVVLAALASAASLVAVATPATAQTPPDDPARGLIYAGLQRAEANSVCKGAFEVLSKRGVPANYLPRCTHGPDPVPVDLDPRPGEDPNFQSSAAAAPAGAEIAAAPSSAGAVGCYGNGTDGDRVQLVYAVQTGNASRYASYEANFRTWAARLDDVYNTSAAETGGIRHIRFVTDGSCQPVIQQITLSSAAIGDFSTMLDDMSAMGLNRTDRKYLVWVDDPGQQKYCGIALVYDDVNPNSTPGVNANNGNSQIEGQVGRVDSRCWGQTNLVEAHELLHTLGGVQSAQTHPQDAPPHATNNSHCFDEADRLCYADGSPTGDPLTGPVYNAFGNATSLQNVCPATHEALLDCNHDDYYSTNPPPGNWLATHWNTANSAWLTSSPPPGTPGTVAGGNAWFSDGTKAHSGPTGTTIKVFGTNAIANVPYQLVSGRNSVVPSQPCGLDLVAVNTNTVFAGSNGLIPAVTGTINRLPGTYQICFAQTDPVTGNRAVTGVSTFTVQ